MGAMRKFECDGYLVEAYTAEQARITFNALSPQQRERYLTRAAAPGAQPPIDTSAQVFARLNKAYREANLIQSGARAEGAAPPPATDQQQFDSAATIYERLNRTYAAWSKRGVR